MRKRVLFMIVTAVLFGATTIAQAEVPKLINYQGRLHDNLGNPVPDGPYSMRFLLYDDELAGASHWADLINNIQVTDGLFNVILGDNTPLQDSVFNYGELWLQVIVEGESITPRTRLVSSAYSQRVTTVDSARGGTIVGPVEVQHSTTSSNQEAVYGHITNVDPGSYTAAVRGENNGTGFNGVGVYGSHDGQGWGVYGTAVGFFGRGVYGACDDGIGTYGTSAAGSGVTGYSDNGTGVTGYSDANVGIYGWTNSSASNAIGIHGVLNNSSAGSFSAAIKGENEGTGATGIGVWGSHAGGGWGVYGVANNALFGRGVYGHSDNGIGLYGSTSTGISGSFDGGRVTITGASDASVGGASSGYLVLGATSGANIVMDNNEIIARDNGAASLLHLQAEGGQVGIGTLSLAVPAGYILGVDGKAIMEEVEVQLSDDWPDYVFEDDYDLMSLDDVKRHIMERKHLPGLPSADEMDGRRLALGEMQTKLLEKVEELTLYVLQLKEQLDESESRNQELRSRVADLENRPE